MGTRYSLPPHQLQAQKQTPRFHGSRDTAPESGPGTVCGLACECGHSLSLAYTGGRRGRPFPDGKLGQCILICPGPLETRPLGATGRTWFSASPGAGSARQSREEEAEHLPAELVEATVVRPH